jgi:glyoxylase-like metal-dependent hydrolase (beta-lactamase superfamily II)
MFTSTRRLCAINVAYFCRTFNGNRHILPIFHLLEESSFMEATLRLATIVSLPFEQNTYVASLGDRKDCIVVDPGLEPQKILQYLDDHQLAPAAILITHGHSDHIGGNKALKERWPSCPIMIGSADAPKLADPWLNLSAPFGLSFTSPKADVLLNDGNTYEAAGFKLHVLSIPGHSVGHVAFLWEGQSPAVVWVGDVIFARSIGRTDFPDGSARQLVSGIRNKLFTLPKDTILLPGHGPGTTVAEELQHNPFVGSQTGGA